MERHAGGAAVSPTGSAAPRAMRSRLDDHGAVAVASAAPPQAAVPARIARTCDDRQTLAPTTTSEFLNRAATRSRPTGATRAETPGRERGDARRGTSPTRGTARFAGTYLGAVRQRPRGPRAAIRGALAALLLTLAGCPSLVQHSTRHAPGRVDLSQPPAREVGDPAAYDAPADPGENRVAILPGASWGMGGGRTGGGAGEVAVQLRFTFPEARDRSLGKDEFPAPWAAWGGTVGWAIAQLPLDRIEHPSHRTVGGPIYAEVNRTWLYATIGLGAAVYPSNPEVGPQISATAAIYMVRARYLPQSGFEIFGGFQLELPTVWTWSR